MATYGIPIGENYGGFLSDLLRWTLLGSVRFIVVLSAGSISSERGTLADSVLSRGISRHQYFLGKWHARLASVMVERDERKPTFGEGKPSDHAPLVVDLR